jgi:DNA invertase Pin-like site-specific DNA recombinase
MAVSLKNPPSETLHIYTRVSTAAQRDDGTSLQTQLEQGKSKAKQLGFGIRHWDEGGKSSHHEELADRPKLAELYLAIKNGEVKHLFVYDQSRLSRNDNVASIFRYECNKQGVTLYTKDGRFDLANPQDKFLKQILDGLSEFDNSMRAERTRLGKLNRTRAGGWHGGPPPYGYKLKDRRLVIAADEATWVKRAFKEAYDGRSPAKIKVLLDSNGVAPRRGGSWTVGSIAALLRNPHYTGTYTFKDKKSGETIQIQCPAILDADLWHAVQLKRKRKFSRVLQQNATTRWFYLLRDLMYCGHCGRPIAGRQRPAKHEKFYYCANKERAWASQGGSKTPWKRGTGCGMDRSLNIPETDALVLEAVRSIHRSSTLLREEVKQRILKTKAGSAAKSKRELDDLKARIRRLEKEVDRTHEVLGSLEGNYEIGSLPKKTFEAKRRVIRENLVVLEVELNNARLSIKGSETQQHYIDWYKQYGESIDNISSLADEQRKEYIAGLVERIDVRYDKANNEHHLAIRFQLPIVGDQLKWNDRGKRSAGYSLLKGSNELPLRISKKRLVSQGKANTP